MSAAIDQKGADQKGAGRTGFDWPGLMRAGLVQLRLRPDQFWALTPVELSMMLGHAPDLGGKMTRDRLHDLITAYPDTPPDEVSK